jgi:Arc/MetJ family transcription regulator
MKTTIEISDELLARAKRQARREHKTLREVVDEALRQRLSAPAGPTFRLKKHPFGTYGDTPSVPEGQWEAIRDLIYRLG